MNWAGRVATPTMLARDRLVARLGARWSVPVVVVTAPAGYGKTTLLAQAAEANATAPVGLDCWVTCVRGLTTVSQLGRDICRVLETAPPAGGHEDAADLARVVVDAMARRSPQPVALLVDDVHEVTAGSETAALLDMVVASLPTNGHLVLVGRGGLPVRLARLDVAGKVVRIDQSELAFTPAELAEFADMRATPAEQLAASEGWPALAELHVNGRPDVVGRYLGEEVLPAVPDTDRRAIALLAHLERVDRALARAVLGDDADVAVLLADLPLVRQVDVDGWHLHSLWQPLLASEVTAVEVQEARRRAGVELARRGEIEQAIPLLVDAEAWGAFDDAIATALGLAHPPVARDVLASWYSRLPREARAWPGGLLLAGVLAVENDPEAAWETLQDCERAFRARGHTAGEIAGLVQRGQLAWWREDADALVTVAARGFELEDEGCEEVVPLACLARALLHDTAHDWQAMIAELDKIASGSLSDAWWGIVTWARAIGLLALGYTSEALEAADEALTHADLLHAPLAEITRLQAIWYEGRLADVQAALPEAVREIKGSGYRHHAALVAAQYAVVQAMVGDHTSGRDHLTQARAAAVGMSDAPLVDTSISVAEAALAAADGDDVGAAAILSAYVERRPLGQGLAVAAQQRHLALFYVLLPETRPIWDAADLGPAWAFGRDLASALVAARDDGRLPGSAPRLADVAAVRAHLPPPWVAELGIAALASGRGDDGWQLLDATWQTSRPTVVGLADRAERPTRTAARDALARLPAPPDRPLELRLLGPVALIDDHALTRAPDWRRQRVRSLLAYLALYGTTSRDKLAEDLWPGMDPGAQSRNLRVTLTYLLRVLEPKRGSRDASFFVRQSGSTIALHPGTWLTVDVWDFDRHVDLANEADRQGSPAVALGHALRAVELWRDDPVELGSEPWAQEAVEDRRLRFATLVNRAGELLLARGETRRALALAQRALDVDPWSERAHRLVVASHIAADDELAARRALRRYGEAASELGITPGETTLMVERLLDSVRPPTGAAPASPSAEAR